MKKFKKGDKVYGIASHYVKCGTPTQVHHFRIQSIGKVQATLNYINKDGKVSDYGDVYRARPIDGHLIFETEQEAWDFRVGRPAQ